MLFLFKLSIPTICSNDLSNLPVDDYKSLLKDCIYIKCVFKLFSSMLWLFVKHNKYNSQFFQIKYNRCKRRQGKITTMVLGSVIPQRGMTEDTSNDNGCWVP